MLKKATNAGIKSLQKLRKRVDVLDEKLIKVFIERFHTTQHIQKLKKSLGMGLYQKKREEEHLARLLSINKKRKKDDMLDAVFIKKLFQLVFKFSKKTGIIKGN